MRLSPSFLARLGGAAALGILACACAPETPYRNAAFAPNARPIPWDGRIAEPGSVRVEGTVTGQGVSENILPTEGSSALHVPKVTLEGAATVAVSRGLELGVRASFARYGWTEVTALGTMPLPGRPDLFGIGPELRASLPLDPKQRFTFGLAANVLHYSMPYAEWELAAPSQGSGAQPVDGASCSPGRPCVDGYRLVQTGSKGLLSASFGIVPTFRLSDSGESLGHVFLWLGGHASFKNDGFSRLKGGGTTIDTDGFIPIFGAGYAIRFKPVRLSGLLFLPFGHVGDKVGLLAPTPIGGALTVGVDLPVFGGKD